MDTEQSTNIYQSTNGRRNANGDPGADGAVRGERALYAAVADPENWFPAGAFDRALGAALRGAAGPPRFTDLDEAVHAAADWSGRESERYRALAAEAGAAGGPDSTGAVLVRRAALGCAPLGLSSGAWLQWLSCPGDADDPAVMDILALYASDVGVGHPRASRGAEYLRLLHALRLSENAAPAARLALDRRIGDWAFRLPAVLLAMSRRPGWFAAELLGADLCLRAVGVVPPLALVRQAHPHAADWEALDPGLGRGADRDGGLEACRRAVKALIEAEPGAGPVDAGPPPRATNTESGLIDSPAGPASRVLLGFGWALGALETWSRQACADLEAALDPAYEMAELLSRRAREGSAYHQRFLIEGRPLSAWLEESRTDPRGLLDALTRSKLIKPGRSGGSSLVNGLVGERGPMFRVFAPEDLDVIRRWIDSLPEEPAAASAHPTPRRVPEPEPEPLGIPVPGPMPVADAPRLSLREAYHRLLRRDDDPPLRRYAREYVEGWLARARTGLDEGETRLPAHWHPGGLRPWLLEQHDRHGADFERTGRDAIPSREALVDSTVQLAPLTLIDGSWLQGFTDYEHASSELGHFLFETYWDELGNGIPRLNHPLIYRQVLAEMDVRLPPTRSADFAAWTGFRDASFELPVYWLCVGRQPRSFMPEILGLNLAMELSGVGGTYRRAHLALKKYGYSTRFVDIHNTIDNVATGHSAWAADAVDGYMAQVLTSGGDRALAEAWERVRAGFRSLAPPDGRRARRAERRGRRSGAAR